MAYCTGVGYQILSTDIISFGLRSEVLHGDMRVRLREIIRQTCSEMGVRIEKGVLSNDHVQCSCRSHRTWRCRR